MNRLFIKSQVNLEWIIYMCHRLKIDTVEDLMTFINYYEISDEWELIFKLWKEVDDVYYPINK